MNSTFFGLMAEFNGVANIPLKEVAPKYFGIKTEAEAKKKASLKKLPIPAFRTGGQKSPWLISVSDLAELIDKRRAAGWKELENQRV